ncbi:hypothetical protein INR49_003997 [Caranx melampygus]|nr:hypothetical protein INR49_003997 [Caranx melampygus]
MHVDMIVHILAVASNSQQGALHHNSSAQDNTVGLLHVLPQICEQLLSTVSCFPHVKQPVAQVSTCHLDERTSGVGHPISTPTTMMLWQPVTPQQWTSIRRRPSTHLAPGQ